MLAKTRNITIFISFENMEFEKNKIHNKDI